MAKKFISIAMAQLINIVIIVLFSSVHIWGRNLEQWMINGLFLAMLTISIILMVKPFLKK